MLAIDIKNLTKSYRKNRGIVNLNLKVAEGEFFGFIGPNGAGKSTTIRTLMGLIKADGGSAKIFGLDIVKDKEAILAQVGYLPSEAIFYQGMRVKDILKFSADLRKKDCREEMGSLCERLQLDLEKKVEELSFGNRKKVAIICALQHSPKLCVLDEPTSGLDPLMQKVFFDILRERNALGTTMFISSHILSEIQKNCKRAAIIREGKIIAVDEVELLANTSVKRVHIQGNVDISALEKVSDLQKSCEDASFLYGGTVSNLLQVLSNQQVLDLTVTEPDLEEIFMHYYQEEG